MSRLRSQQARVLRRRLTLQTLVALAAYTALFVVLALVANATLVPRIANAVADATGDSVRYDPKDYLRSRSVPQLIDMYMQDMADEGFSGAILWELPEEDLERLRAQMLEGATPDRAAAEEEVWDALALEALIQMEEGGEASAVYDEAVDLVDGREELSPWTVAVVMEYPSEKGGSADAHARVLTLDYLAHQAAWLDFEQTRGKTQNWDVWSEGEGDPYAPFVVRDLTTYRSVKLLKLPLAVLLYLVGCLGIALWQMQRALRCFDELSGAVAGLMADRSNPVELPPKLAIAQSELNRIRLESLADERAAAAAEQRKNELVAYLAHDIRTPLTSVIGYLSLLDESPDLPAEQRRRFTRTAFAKAERLESLIEELFEITRYNLQAIPIERSTVDVQLFLEQIADEFFPQASEKDVALRVHAPEGQTFFVDGEHLARAVGNVVRNAVAYADPGTAVDVTARCESLGAHGASWTITVVDRGREISPAHLESIFEKFYREDGARGAQSGGAGLGLAIAKEIVAAHDGTIAAESRDGRTTFTITL